MANIITISFFSGGELNIAGTETTSIQERVTDLIEKYELEYLQKSLGYPLWKAFHGDNYPTPATQRFQDLLNGGVEYQDCKGYTRLWPGLKVSNKSPLAAFIWYWYQRDNASFNSSMGEEKGQSENATNVSVAIKQSRAWNEMVRTTHIMWEYLTAKAAIYPEFDIHQVECSYFRVISFI